MVLKLVITKTYLCIFTTQDPYLLSGLDLIEWIRPLMVIDFKLPPFVSEEKSTIESGERIQVPPPLSNSTGAADWTSGGRTL